MKASDIQEFADSIVGLLGTDKVESERLQLWYLNNATNITLGTFDYPIYIQVTDTTDLNTGESFYQLDCIANKKHFTKRVK